MRDSAGIVWVAGGLDWAYDLSGVMKGRALHDRGADGIVYATHVYHWHGGWQQHFLDVAAKYPVLVGEAGCEVKPLPFIPAAQQEDPATWAPDMLAVIQKYKLNWTAWSFHPGASPRLLAGWDYRPTAYWREPVCAALRGQAFQLSRLR